MIKNKDYNVFVDNEFARWCSDHNTVWNDSNFFVSEDVTTLVLQSLIRFKNKLQQQGRYTDCVDELILKVSGTL